MPLEFSHVRARTAGVCITAVALWAAVACGSDDDAPASTDGAGGDQASGGSGQSSGGTHTAGGGGETSTDGGGGSGDFSAIWQAESTELMLFDAADPSSLESHTVEVPAKVAAPGDEREVELYVQFEGEQRITYAYTEGDPAYYRILTPATRSGDEFYAVQTENGTHSYYFEDGKLIEGAQQVFGSAWSGYATTTYREVKDFPPGDWPSKAVTYEVGGAQ
ncbi:MAG TPA: hypothetical protein VI197_05965 [Polyangiaceae bacterium]